MLIPESWGNRNRGDASGTRVRRQTPVEQTNENLKRRKTRDRVPENAPPSGETEVRADVYEHITGAISLSIAASPECGDAVLDTVLSRIPYRQILEDLFGCEERGQADVPIVTRAYEESFMRAPFSGERACVMGAACECMFIDPHQAFVGTEFVIPCEEQMPQAHMCVLCCRKVTQALLHDMLFSGVSFRGVIQRYGNICEQPGEYSRQAVLVCPPNGHVQCMPLPIVAHQRNRYSVHVRGGVKCLRQHRVGVEDFQ